MKKFLAFLLLLPLFALGLCLPAQTNALLMTGPDIIAAPSSVIDDSPGAENDHQQAFNEQQNVQLLTDLAVDGSGVISAGTWVDSHMIFLNTPGTTYALDTQTWTFETLILGVMSDGPGALEAASSGILGASGTTYPAAFASRGLEGGDSYTILNNTITVTMSVTEPGDWMRVVTAAESVPEPATMFLFGFGLLGLAGFRRRFRKR